MPSNKNQHFVPKCYLRAFTKDQTGHSINVYNLQKNLLITDAPVKNQCSGDYFYGEDLQVEKSLQKIEGDYAQALVAARMNSSNSQLLDVFKSFWLTQYIRTEAASRREAELAAKIDDFVDSEPHRISMTIRETVQAAMARIPTMRFSVMDLRGCLIRNRSHIPFVSSDDPAVLTNKWYNLDDRCAGIAYGLSSAGTLCVLPLSPEILFLAYDNDVYRIEKKDGWGDLKRDHDALAFNQIQFLNCRANIYFHAQRDGMLWQKQAQLLINRRIPERHRLNVAILESDDGITRTYKQAKFESARNSRDTLMHTEELRPTPAAWPSQIRLRNNGRAIMGKAGTGYVRKGQTDLLGLTDYHKIKTC
jgi:hypothetical protein